MNMSSFFSDIFIRALILIVVIVLKKIKEILDKKRWGRLEEGGELLISLEKMLLFRVFMKE